MIQIDTKKTYSYVDNKGNTLYMHIAYCTAHNYKNWYICGTQDTAGWCPKCITDSKWLEYRKNICQSKNCNNQTANNFCTDHICTEEGCYNENGVWHDMCRKCMRI